jgi:oxaloacetate decarboxylase gamma subunit
MTVSEMFVQSGALALLGMTMVFGFLIIMVICVTFSGKIIHALGLDRDTQMPKQAGAQAVTGGGPDSGAITALISAAVNEHRKNI